MTTSGAFCLGGLAFAALGDPPESISRAGSVPTGRNAALGRGRELREGRDGESPTGSAEPTRTKPRDEDAWPCSFTIRDNGQGQPHIVWPRAVVTRLDEV